ncbi:MAG: DUF192 domain-containing protein [Candidatus Micrarchaeia archaeon]
MKTSEAAVLLIAALLLILIFYFATAKGERKKISISNPGGAQTVVDVEIANSSVIRAKGLMGRTALPEGEGMLFVFDAPSIPGFWMLNTTIPLEAIHFSENGTVVDIIEMEPCGLNITNCPIYRPSKPSMYVLEVNAGFSKRHGIEKGESKLDPGGIRKR